MFDHRPLQSKPSMYAGIFFRMTAHKTKAGRLRLLPSLYVARPGLHVIVEAWVAKPFAVHQPDPATTLRLNSCVQCSRVTFASCLRWYVACSIPAHLNSTETLFCEQRTLYFTHSLLATLKYDNRCEFIFFCDIHLPLPPASIIFSL